ncbi:MAG: hypothetical protein JO040_12290 [Gemmatimonadetes bacterium]|nr:hypothetical protein [Gemmatimonadota bacterium]
MTGRSLLRSVLPAALVLAALAAPAGAQRRAPSLSSLRTAPGVTSPLPSAPRVQAEREPGVPLLVGGGIGGGLAGLVAGAYLGYGVELGQSGCHDEELCGLGGALLGAALGEALLLPYGVHLADRSRGSYGRTFLASFGTGAAGLLLLGATGEAAGELWWAVPVAQIAAAVAVERRTARRRTSIHPVQP